MKIKTLPGILILLAGSFLSGCDDYDDTPIREQLENHEQRLSALEEWQKQMNGNLSAIQTLLNTQDYITSVTPVTTDGKIIGYNIQFTKSSPITVYNGEQGIKGDTPCIDIIRSDNGNWYWTVDGTPMTDESGNPIYAKGNDGTPAPAPQISLGSNLPGGIIKTDNGSTIQSAWYLSVDNGQTWYRINGTDGEKGDQGDAWFAKAPEPSADGKYYIFTLSNGDSFQVPIYQKLALTFTGLSDLTQTILVPGSLELAYTTGENMPAPIVTVLISGEGWKAVQQNNTIHITTGADKKAVLVVIVTDNKETSFTYTLSLERKDADINGYTHTVYTPEGLLAWSKAMETNHFINCTLGADIDMAGVDWETPYTTFYDAFKGTINGNGHTIYNLNARNNDAKDWKGSGLIAYGSCTIKDLTLVNPTIVAEEGDAGALASYMNESTIVINCHVVGGSITAKGYAGGLVGSMRYPAILIASSSSAAVTGVYAGGIAGWNNDDGKVLACYATGSVTGTATEEVQKKFTNGISGRSNGIISACYWDVSGAEYGYADNYAIPKTEGAEKVDGTIITWEKAMEEMNTFLNTYDYPQHSAPYKGKYQYTLNEGANKDTCPLLVVKTDK